MASAYAHMALVRLAQAQGAVEDNEYPEILHLSTAFEGFGSEGVLENEAVLPQLRKACDMFEMWGADIVVIACNSLHSVYGDLQQHYGFKITNLPVLGAEEAQKCGIGKVAIMSSASALKDQFHSAALQERHVEAITATAEQQQSVNSIIKMVMAGTTTHNIVSEVKKLAQQFKAAGAQAIMLGCTELSVFFNEIKAELDMPVIDCLAPALQEALCLTRK